MNEVPPKNLQLVCVIISYQGMPIPTIEMLYKECTSNAFVSFKKRKICSKIEKSFLKSFYIIDCIPSIGSKMNNKLL